MKKVEPNLGERRVVKRYVCFSLALPWCIKPDARIVTRSWEKAEVWQEYMWFTGRYGIRYTQWRNIAWADISPADLEELEAVADW